MMFDGEFSEPWGDGEARESRLCCRACCSVVLSRFCSAVLHQLNPLESRFCFIGKNLDKDKVPHFMFPVISPAMSPCISP
jgi:hypothetical protein